MWLKSAASQAGDFGFTRWRFAAFLSPSKAKLKMARTKKIQWPLGFAEMLGYAFKKKRPEDRLKYYRLFLRDFFHTGSTVQASPETIEKALAEDRNKKFDENWAFHIRMWSESSFDKWKRESYIQRSKRRAVASWSKSARLKRKRNRIKKAKTPP